MAKQTVTAHLFMELDYAQNSDGRPNYDAGKVWIPTLWKCRVSDEDGRVYVGEQSVTVEVPEDFNPVPAQVAALEREKAEALRRYQASVAQINERLPKLLAITHEA